MEVRQGDCQSFQSPSQLGFRGLCSDKGACLACTLKQHKAASVSASPHRKQQGPVPQRAHSDPSSLESASASCHPPT